MQSIKYGLWLVVLMGLVMPTVSLATVTWSFNWYCAGCSKIGARTTGTEGPFASESACESARSWMRSRYRSGDVDTMPCSSQGLPDTPRSPDSSRDSGSTGRQTNAPPDVDYERESARWHEERLEAKYQRREAERLRQEAEQRTTEESRQRTFVREREAAVTSLKGSSSAPFGIKGNPEDGVTLKTSRHNAYLAPQTAWEKLHCAGSLSIDAIRAANQDAPDIEEVRFLGQETMKALNGEKMEVGCSTQPISVPPGAVGKAYPDVGLQRKFFAGLMSEVLKQTGRIVELKNEALMIERRRTDEAVQSIDVKMQRIRQQERQARSVLAQQEQRVQDALSKPATVFPSQRRSP